MKGRATRRAPGGPSRRERRQSALVPGAVISAVTADPRDPSLAHVRIGRRSAAKIEYEGEWGAAAIGAVAGAVLDEQLIDAILRGQARTDARYWALRILSRSAVSRGGLIAKLQRKGRGRGSARDGAGGIDVGTATRIADELQAKGFLDDRRYAESVVAAELRRKPAGARLLEMKLRAKRVEPGVAREVVAAAMGELKARQHDRDEDPLKPAMDLARRKLRTMGGGSGRGERVDEQAAARRVYSLLARRGFDPDVCREVTKRVVGDSRNKL